MKAYKQVSIDKILLRQPAVRCTCLATSASAGKSRLDSRFEQLHGLQCCSVHSCLHGCGPAVVWCSGSGAKGLLPLGKVDAYDRVQLAAHAHPRLAPLRAPPTSNTCEYCTCATPP